MNGNGNGNGNGVAEGILRFDTNVPVEVALAYPDGKLVEGRYGDQYLYTLTDGRRMYVPPIVPARIAEQQIGPKERFVICKREVKRAGGKPGVEWQVMRVEKPQPVGEPAAAVAPAASPAVQNTNSTSNGTSLEVPLAASTLAACLTLAVDALLKTREYAASKGWTLEFNEEDVRNSGITLFIQLSKMGGGPWQR